jgi:hypothetical protein
METPEKKSSWEVVLCAEGRLQYKMMFYFVLWRLVDSLAHANLSETCCFHLQKWSLQPWRWRHRFSGKMASTGQSTRRYNPEHHHNPHSRENLKFQTLLNFKNWNACILRSMGSHERDWVGHNNAKAIWTTQCTPPLAFLFSLKGQSTD